MVSSFARAFRSIEFWFTVVAFAASARSQCPHWISGDGVRGTGEVFALAHWDLDGSGPAPARVVIGGRSTIAGEVAADNVASFDPATGEWAAFGSGTNGTVRAIVGMPNGDLVIGGDFTLAGGVAASRVARWNGTTWAPLGGGMDGAVLALSVASNGDLFAGGEFQSAGGVNASRIARWNGTAWSPVGSGVDGTVMCLQAMPNGDVVAGGGFWTVGGTIVNFVARWDGSAWSPLGSGTTGPVHSLGLDGSGALLVGGWFVQAGGQPAFSIARWDGAGWSAFAMGVGGAVYSDWTVYSLATLPNGDIIAGGRFELASGVVVDNIARWDGAWHAVSGGAAGPVRALVVTPGGELFAGGTFSRVGGEFVNNIGRWDGSSWSTLAPGFTGSVHALAELPNGDLVAGGAFTAAGAASANRVARWNGMSWSPMGAGMDGAVSTIVVLANGDVVAGGSFATAGGITVNNVARWDGQTWSPLGTGCNAAVTRLLRRSNGDLIAAGSFTTAGGVVVDRIAVWDGLAWSALPSIPGGPFVSVSELVELPDGALVVAGAVSFGDVRVLRWDGTAWAMLGGPIGAGFLGQLRALIAMPNGNLVAAGRLSPIAGYTVTGVVQWDGSSWTQMGPNVSWVSGLTLLPNGHLLASGGPEGLYRWDGAAWSPLLSSPGVTALAGFVSTTARYGATGLALGGTFTFASGQVSVNFARIDTNCPALAAPLGIGCASSGGTNTLTASQLPWVETAFRATGTGLPNPGIVVAVTGTGSIPAGLAPLSAILSQGQPGCFVLVTPDILQPLLATNGTAQSELFLPGSAALTGVTFFHQMIPIEVDATGNFVAITATNALRLTAGEF